VGCSKHGYWGGALLVSLPVASIINTVDSVSGAMHPAAVDQVGFSASNRGLVAVGAEVPARMNW
jgi:hypothetical protein